MDISQVIQFEGRVDDLVWKSPVEDFNTSSVLICDETHEALVLVNGVQYGVYSAGRHVLETPNIPIAKKLINIPSNGKTTFPCKVFFVNKLHQMSMDWGIPGNIALEDPIYHVFLHIGAHGGANFFVKHTAKFLEKLVGFRDVFDPNELTNSDSGMFRSVINKYVTSDLAKIMISGNVSYFTIAENLFEISDVLKEQLNDIFDEYGIGLKEFVIEGVTTREEDYAEVQDAKSKYMARKVQGYTWQDEANVDILKTFAGNQGVAGGIGGAMGGFMVGGAMGSSIADLARSVLQSGGASGNGANCGSGPSISGGSGMNVANFLNNFNSQNQSGQQQNIPSQQPQQNTAPQQMQPNNQQAVQQFNQVDQNAAQSFNQVNPQGMIDPFSASGAPVQMNQQTSQVQPVQPQNVADAPVCTCGVCGATYNKIQKFCTKCGNPISESKPKKYCPECGNELEPDDIFCGNCGHKF